MVTEIRIYYEGDTLLRQGFDKFFSELHVRAKEIRCKLMFISANGTPCQDFESGIASHPDAWCILLKDSEGPDIDQVFVALRRRYRWSKERADSIFWMVEMMESWFHADKVALKEFYGESFRETSLKRNPRVEQISKRDLVRGLDAATRKTPKGSYFDNKTSHGPALLGKIDSKLVRKAAPNCQRLFNAVLSRLE